MSSFSRQESKQTVLTIALGAYAASTLISMAVMSIATGVLVIAMLWASGGPRSLLQKIQVNLRESVWARRYAWVSLALTLTCFGSLIWAKAAPLSYGGKFSEVHLLKDSLKLWYLFWPLPLLVGLESLTAIQRKKVILSWVGTCAILGIIAIIQHYTGWPRPQAIPSWERPLKYHATLFLGHHLSVASILIFPFFASLEFFKRERSWFWGAGAILGATALILTYSRTLWAAFPVALLVWAFANLSKRAKVMIVVTLALVGIGASQINMVQERFKGIHFQQSLMPREDLWKANLDFLRERPLLGVGWKHNQELSGYYLMEKYSTQEVFSGHAHNNLLDMLGGTGIAGALSWLTWSILVMVMAWVAWKRTSKSQSFEKLGLGSSASASTLVTERGFAAGLFCAWIAFQLNGLTQVNFWEAKVTHQLMWVVAWSLLWLRSDERAK
jgi:O-antigen ligase